MARVSIEVRAAAAAKKLARAMGWTRTDAIGRLYYFWHDSQELEQTHCTFSDIVLWMDIDRDAENDIVPAMIEAGFISEDGDRFLICGNDKHIENLKQHREAAKRGGQRSGEVRALNAVKRLPQQNEASASTDRFEKIEAYGSTESQVPVEPSSLQFSAVQFSTIQKEEEGAEGSKNQEPVAVVFGDEDLQGILSERGVKQKQFEAWLKAYPEIVWVTQEIKRAAVWEISNPANKKKNFAAFIARWLAKGWDTRQRNPNTPQELFTGGEQRVKCDDCTLGLIRAINRSSGASEHCACSCFMGRKKTSYVRFDENRFERVA